MTGDDGRAHPRSRSRRRRETKEPRRLAAAPGECQPASTRGEEYFRTLIENTSDVVTILNQRGTILYESPSVERLLGYRVGELIGRDVMDFIHPEDRAAARAALARAIQHAGVSQSIEVRLQHGDGSWRIFEAVGKGLTGPPGTAQVVMSSRDVTERRRMEEEARQRQAELSHLLRLKTMGEMAAGIAHELNQPLAAIANYAKGCAWRIRTSAGEPAEILPALDEIAGQAMRAGEVIRRLRNFVRKGELRREIVEVNDLVREVTSFVEAEAREHAVRLQLDLAPRLPAVCVDIIQIEQVILNLVRNGLEALSGVGPDVRALDLQTSRADPDTVAVAVRDSGQGFPQEIAGRIFEPFFSTKSGGLGMGLSIGRSIVEAHGGRLWGLANRDRGATFQFTLPVHKRHDDGAQG